MFPITKLLLWCCSCVLQHRAAVPHRYAPGPRTYASLCMVIPCLAAHGPGSVSHLAVQGRCSGAPLSSAAIPQPLRVPQHCPRRSCMPTVPPLRNVLPAVIVDHSPQKVCIFQRSSCMPQLMRPCILTERQDEQAAVQQAGWGCSQQH